MSTENQPRSLFDPEILRPALIESLRKLDPRVQARNPVMFVVEIGALITTVAWLIQVFGAGPLGGGHEPSWFTFSVTVWLWLTVVFANLAEALAEGRGRAQAASLRSMRTETVARLRDGGEKPAAELVRGDVVVVEAGEAVPGDGTVIEGIASVDESAITGESAPVIREAGGDRSAVTGGTKVLSDRIVVVAESASIDKFFNPRSVAVIGASRRQDTVGQALVRNLVLGDYAGRVYVVNPLAKAVSGLPAYSAVGDIPGDVDVAIVAVPAESVQDVVLDCAAKGVHGMIIISSGFAEIGEEGRHRQRRLVGLSRSYGLRVIGPNCLGIINTDPQVSLNASLSSQMPARGRAGFFCQSGALGTAILEKVNNRGLGLSTFVSAGNRADVSGNDLLQYWEEDDSTEVVLLYLESIGNPRKFSRIARRVSLRKPIIAMRSGRTTQGVPMGHSVRTIGAPPQAVDAMFRQAGVIQVDTLDEMFDVAQLVAHQPLPRGRRVAIVGNSDALGLLAADAAASVGLVVTRSVALGAEATGPDFEDALDAAIDDAEVDSVVAVYIPPIDVSSAEVADVLAAVGEQSDKPLVSSFLGVEGVPELLRVPDVAGSTAGRGSVPSYPAVEAAVRALARVVDYAVWLRTPNGPTVVPAEVDPAAAKGLVHRLLIDNPDGTELEPDDLDALLTAYGIDLWEARRVTTLAQATKAGRDLGWDVVLKATTDRLRERPDLAHVWRNIDRPAEMRDAWQSLVELIDDSDTAGFVVQKVAQPGVPLSIRSMEDPLFGPVVSFGISGPLSELLEDRSYRIPPLGARDPGAMTREIKAAPMLFGYRGSEVVDIAAVEDLLSRVAQLQHDLPQVSSLELSLVLAGADHCSVLTARARVDPVSDPRSDWFVRRLPAAVDDTIPG